MRVLPGDVFPSRDVSRILRRHAQRIALKSRYELYVLMSEEELQEAVIARAIARGWKAWHQWSALHTGAGWPDLVLVRPSTRELVFAELKREGEVPTLEQRDTLLDLAECGQEVYLWRPSDEEEWQAVIDR